MLFFGNISLFASLCLIFTESCGQIIIRRRCGTDVVKCNSRVSDFFETFQISSVHFKPVNTKVDPEPEPNNKSWVQMISEKENIRILALIISAMCLVIFFIIIGCCLIKRDDVNTESTSTTNITNDVGSVEDYWARCYEDFNEVSIVSLSPQSILQYPPIPPTDYPIDHIDDIAFIPSALAKFANANTIANIIIDDPPPSYCEAVLKSS